MDEMIAQALGHCYDKDQINITREADDKVVIKIANTNAIVNANVPIGINTVNTCLGDNICRRLRLYFDNNTTKDVHYHIQRQFRAEPVMPHVFVSPWAPALRTEPQTQHKLSPDLW